MKYGIVFLVGSMAVLASLWRFRRQPERRPSVGSVSDRWLLSQRSDPR